MAASLAITRLLWICTSLAVLCICLLRPGTNESDTIVFMIYGMLALSIPAGFLVVGLVVMLVFVEEYSGLYFLDIESRVLGLIVVWSAFVTVGYIQWFILLPKISRLWRSR